MKGQAPERSRPDASFSWPGAIWTVIMAAAMYGLYCLQEYRVLSEEQIVLLVFVAVPIAAFLLSGKGQVRGEAAGGQKDERSE